MSVKCGSTSPPPQTYSRLFRPWDGKTQQDSTITSTTTQPIQVPASGNSMDSSEIKIECNKDIISETTTIYPITQDATSESSKQSSISANIINEFPLANNSLIANSHPKIEVNQVPRLPPHLPEYFPNAAFYSPAPVAAPTATPSYHDLIVPNLPFMGVDPFTMEQEYARVLAEEAQVKMMTARRQRPKKFKCPHCEVAFSNNGQLKGHIRIHTGNEFTTYLEKEYVITFHAITYEIIFFCFQVNVHLNVIMQIVEKHLRETKN